MVTSGGRLSRMAHKSIRNGEPPAVVLGGGVTALSVARSLARAGIAVHVLDGPKSPARVSRAIEGFVDVGTEEPQARMLEWLRATELAAVVVPACDYGIELVARNRADLIAHGQRPMEGNDDVLLAMLNKVQTYELARRHGVAAPRIIRLRDEQGVRAVIDELEFPCV